MPYEVQDKMVHSLPGLENAKILKYAYAIEYDAIYPTQINRSLETKILKNLYTAGQINGTSGYEEAAGQGLIAGINASLKIEGKDPLILKRNESYIGVLIDDLVNKGIKDPYRLLTSRAEYRLLLRSDNADLRLRKYGYEVGLISKELKDKLDNKIKNINLLLESLKSKRITPKTIPEYYKNDLNIDLKNGISVYEFLKRPEVTIDSLIKTNLINDDYNNEVYEQVMFIVKYEGYIEKENAEIKKILKLEEKQIPANINYDDIKNIASEARQKLKIVRPLNLGQASRISGVNPADISILSIYLKKEYNKNDGK